MDYPCGDFDLAMCLYTDGEEVLGACCDDEVGVCREDVPAGECTGRFLVGQSCAEFDPPCEAPTGACCHADGTCTYETLVDCEGVPGDRGDLNCDGYKNFDDIEPFVLALVDQDQYEDQYPDCEWVSADCNVDGSVNFDDISAFVTALTASSDSQWLGASTGCAWCPPQPIALPAELPYVEYESFTCNRGNDFDDTALGLLDSGEDVLYELVVSEPVSVEIVTDPAYDSPTPNLLLTASYPPGYDYLALSTVGGSLSCQHLDPGTYYLLVDTWGVDNCIEDFDLFINACTPPVGQCCYGEPVECVEVMEHECVALGGVWDADLDCSTPCFVEGDDCASAIEISAPTSLNLNSPYYGADGPAAPCDKYGAGHLMQKDVWLRWTPPDDGLATVTVESTSVEFDPVLVVRSGCGDADVLLCSDQVAGVGVQEFVQFPFTANTTYYFQIGEAGPHPSGEPAELLFDIDASYGEGACCFADGSCRELRGDDCVALGGSYLGDWVECGPESCPEPELGDSCGSVASLTITADVLPLTVVGSTVGRNNDYDDTCLGGYDSGRDVVYRLTVPAPIVVNITLDPGSVDEEPGTPFTAFALSKTCPPTDCIVTARNAEGVPYGVEYVVLREGTYYLMVDKWLLPDEIPEFELVIELADDDTGACCVGEECVGTMTLAECMAVEGRWNRGEVCSPGEFCYEDYGDTCERPHEFGFYGDGFSESGSTYDHSNTYVGQTCLGIADGGRDMVYKLIMPEPETRLVELSLSTDSEGWGHMWAVLSDSCPPVEESCLARVPTNGASAPLELAPGEYYVLIDMWPVRTYGDDWLDGAWFEVTIRALDGL